MHIEWSDDLAVGFSRIDDQHRELFKRVNSLIDAIWDGKGKDEVMKFINFLSGYVVDHFGDEEAFMMRYDFPKYREHKALHDAFIAKFERIATAFESGDAPPTLVTDTADDSCTWLRNHIRIMDKELGGFLKTKSS